jgi:hypothetical protein
LFLNAYNFTIATTPNFIILSIVLSIDSPNFISSIHLQIAPSLNRCSPNFIPLNLSLSSQLRAHLQFCASLKLFCVVVVLVVLYFS